MFIVTVKQLDASIMGQFPTHEEALSFAKTVLNHFGASKVTISYYEEIKKED